MDIKIDNNILMKKLNSDINKLSKEAKEIKNDKKLKDACKDFESFFLYYMFKEMKKTVPEYDIVKKSNGEKIYESFYLEQITKKMADRGGIGIADMIYNNFKQEKISK